VLVFGLLSVYAPLFHSFTETALQTSRIRALSKSPTIHPLATVTPGISGELSLDLPTISNGAFLMPWVNVAILPIWVLDSITPKAAQSVVVRKNCVFVHAATFSNQYS